MIQRFEDEYPETRLSPPATTVLAPNDASDNGSIYSSLEDNSTFSGEIQISETDTAATEAAMLTEDDEETIKAPLSRHNSDVSLASRALSLEEGRMHRFGQKMRRDILRPQTLDHAHGTTGEEGEADHLRILRGRLETLGGEEIKEKVDRMGPEAVLKEIGASAEELAILARKDPEGFAKFREAVETGRPGV